MLDDRADIIRMIGALHHQPARFERCGRGLAHGDLPRIELAPFAAHGHQRDDGKAAIAHQRESIEAIADTARLHQQDTPLAGEIRPGQYAELPYFLGGEDDPALIGRIP